MNCSVYIFGELSSGYTQYPEDSSSHILSNLITNCKAATQLIIKREDNLIYYSYIRKLDNNKYIGLSILVNGYYIQNVKDLFSIFEKTLEELVTTGSIVCFSQDGKIIPSQRQLREQEEDIDTISIKLSSEFNNASKSYKLPSVDYSVAKDSIKEYSINDDITNITRSSYTYGFTYIYKDNDYNTVKVDSYRSVLNRISTENIELKKKNTALHEENQKILRKKKQFRNVILLFLVVIGCGIGIYFLYNNLNYTQDQLTEANETIELKNNTIEKKNSKISLLKNSVDSLNKIIKNEREVRNTTEEKLNKICSINPFVVTSFSVSSDAVDFDYEAVEEKEVTVTLKAVNEKNSQIVSSTHTDTYYNGGGTKKMYFSKSLYTSDYYYVVLIYDGKIIAGKRW